MTSQRVVEKRLDGRLAQVHLTRDHADDVIGRPLTNFKNSVQGPSLEVREGIGHHRGRAPARADLHRAGLLKS